MLIWLVDVKNVATFLSMIENESSFSTIFENINYDARYNYQHIYFVSKKRKKGLLTYHQNFQSDDPDFQKP